jgi:hypothetical protein
MTLVGLQLRYTGLLHIFLRHGAIARTLLRHALVHFLLGRLNWLCAGRIVCEGHGPQRQIGTHNKWIDFVAHTTGSELEITDGGGNDLFASLDTGISGGLDAT